MYSQGYIFKNTNITNVSLNTLTSKRNFNRNIQNIHVVFDILLHCSYQIKFLMCPISYYVFQVEKGEVSEMVQNNENEGKATLLLS